VGRSKAIAVTAMLLVLLAGTQLAVPRAATAASTSSQGGWWNDSYQFRRSVTLVNGGQNPFVNQTVILHLDFAGNDVEDPVTGLRLVNSSGVEVPSAVVGVQYSGSFLRSAYLLFLVDLPPKSSADYYVYYGTAFQSVPSYRGSGPLATLSSGFVTATMVPASLDSAQIQLGFGSVDTESTITRVSYSSPAGPLEYGPTTFSQNPLTNDTGLILAAQLDPQTTVAYEDVQAGSVQLTRILVISSKSALTIDAVADGSSTAASNVTLTSVVDLSGLSSLGSSQSSYNDGAGLLYTENPDAYFGMQQSEGAASFALGTLATVTSEALNGRFTEVSSYSLASAAGFTWNLGDIQPGASAWVSSSWGVALGESLIGASLPAVPVGATLGQVEVQSAATPTARSLWSTIVTLTGVTVPSTGLAIPLGIGGGTLVPGASTVNGTYAYTVPVSPQVDSKSWTADTSSTGNATSFASPQYFAFDLGSEVERLSATVPNAASTATTALISNAGFAFRGTNAVLQVKYKASYSVASGSLSAQDFFVAADIDPTLTGNFSESVVLPVTGSSITIPTTGCPSSGSTGTEFEQGSPASFLIGDNTWRTLTVSLPTTLPASGFDVKLRLCLSTSPGFSGNMDLEVASAGVVLRGSASNVIRPTFSYTAPELTIGYLPQASSLASIGTTANLTISLVYQKSASIGWHDGSTFSGVVTAPSIVTVNDSALRQFETIGPVIFGGVLVSSAVSQFVDSGQVNGVVGSTSPGPGMALVTSGSTSADSGGPFVVGLRSEAVQVSVVDENGAGVPGATVFPLTNGLVIPVTSVTNGSGIALVQMVPWAFQFNATYQGRSVGSTQILAGAPPSVKIVADLYTLTLLVKDVRGGALGDAQVNLYIGDYNFSGTTDGQGRYTFESIANALYNLTIVVGSGTYFNGQIAATANNAVVGVTTSYLPSTIQLFIIAAVAVVPVVVIGAYFLARRLRHSA
jgi:hypothetical protein